MYKTGPGESILIRIAIANQTGKNTTNTNNDIMISISRLVIITE